jgi:Carboxypeptidase regulatory-like domain
MSRNAKSRRMKLCVLGVWLQCSAICAGQNQTGAQTPAETSATPTKIAGTVVSAMTGTPLAQTRVSIADTKNRAKLVWMITNESGRFEFDHIPAGKYSLVGAKRGFLTTAYEQHEQFSTAIVTGREFDTTQLVLRLTPMASIEGKVVDEAGDPVRQGQVTLYRENKEMGFGRIARVNFGSTNDLGTFEFASLAPGRYYVAVSARPWYAVHPVVDSGESTSSPPPPVDRSLDVSYPTTYSGGATDADGALAIELKGGERSEVEMHVFPVPSLHIIFRVPDDDGQHGWAPPMFERRVFDSSEFINSLEVRRVSQGVYELTGVPAGTYSVRMPNRGSSQEVRTGEVDLSSDGQELDTTRGEPEGSLKLTIQMPQQEGIPKGMRIMLRDKQNRNRTFQELDANRQATIEYLPAGKYSIVIYSPGKPYSVVRTSSEAGETTGHDVNVPSGGTLTLTAVLAAGSANIEGFVKRSGTAASGVMVVLIPKESSTREELFRRDQSDSDGSFSLRSVIPGEYTLVAIEDAWGFDWSKPGQLARYAQHGQAITIPEGVQTTIQLPEAIEVQPR